MKPTMTMLVCALGAGLGWAQSPSIIQNTRNTMNAVRDNEAAATNAALGLQEKAPSRTSVAPTASKASSAAVVPVDHSPMTPRPAKPSKPARAGAIHKEAAPKAALVEPKTTAPLPGTAASSEAAGNGADAEDPSASDRKYNPNGKRDPFLSPVVSHAGGSSCSTGKKCLEIGTISLRGIVHSENGFIAVVSNSLNKAYFLRENDPVFNGYVVKITDDSIVFQETLQDRLGKSFTREVVKKITTPAV
jgi:hypothetical protein